MRLKYNEGETPLRNEHAGFVYSKIRELLNAGYARKEARTRYPSQFQRMQNLMKCTRFWRTMSPATVQAWNDFAAMFPQPTKADPDVYLTGYQLFLKRNQYCFLNHGTETDFMETPVLSIPPAEPIIFRIAGGENSIDATELYIKRFGILPKPGDFVFLHAIVMHEFSGNFYPQYDLKLEVEEVFVDGLFVQVEIPDSFRDCTVSVYLSKPAGRGQNFAGSTIRYMGCFTKKTFLQLTDTPNSYAGQAGKVVTVKEDETGLEFTEPGGGGLNCEDLLECPAIISIVTIIQDIINAIIPDINTSVPPVHYGLLYNGYARENELITSSAEWSVMLKSDWDIVVNHLGGLSVATPHIKDYNPLYWVSVPPETDNSSGLNVRGAGKRDIVTGNFYGLKTMGGLSARTTYRAGLSVPATNAALSYVNDGLIRGVSVRLKKSATGKADGIIGVYTGNNGRSYRTITIAGLEVLADNLAETMFRGGVAIPEVTDNATWAAMTSAALCAYDNDWSNV